MMLILINIKLNWERHYKYRNLSEEEKEIKRGYGRNWYRNMAENWKEQAKGVLKKLSGFKILIFLYYKNEWKEIKLNDVEFDKKENDASKQPIVLNSMLINKTVVSDKFEQIFDILLVRKKKI